jgi:serine/threonine-protein kinase HipA
LLVEVEGARYALPGSHHKIPLRVSGSQIAVALGNAVSSHIAKPAKEGLRESVMNEGFCLELARAMDLECVNAEIRHAAVTILIVERIDRYETNGTWSARHMEDFCQLMGVPPEKKYQREGGLGPRDCLDCIRRYSCVPAHDMLSFLRWLMFNYLIGNGGAHAKQLAMLHYPEGPRMAPFYGIMSTHVYPTLSPLQAMLIGGEDRPDWMIANRWRQFSTDTGVRSTFVLELLRDMADRIPSTSTQVAEEFQRQHGFASIIRDIRNLINQRARPVLGAREAERI